MTPRPLPSRFRVIRTAARREWISHRLNRFLHAHVLLTALAGLLPLLSSGDGLAAGAAYWLLHAVLYALSLSSLLLGLSSAQAEAEEVAWLLGQPVGIGPWLVGKAAALAAMAAATSLFLVLPTALAVGFSPALWLVGGGAAGVSCVCALTGLAIGFWVRDPVRGLIAAVAAWFGALFGLDLMLLAFAGSPLLQQYPDFWVAPLMANPLDAFRVTVLFAAEKAAFSGIDAGRLTGWWLGHPVLWLAASVAAWLAATSTAAWLGARRRSDG